MTEKVPLFILAVTGVVIRGNKFLAGKRSVDEIAFPGKWTVPGGKVESGQSITQCLKREILEEAGVKANNFNFVYDYTFTRPDGHNVLELVLVCDYVSGEPKIGDNMDEVKWLTIQEAEKLDFIPGIVDYVKEAFEISLSITWRGKKGEVEWSIEK